MSNPSPNRSDAGINLIIAIITLFGVLVTAGVSIYAAIRANQTALEVVELGNKLAQAQLGFSYNPSFGELSVQNISQVAATEVGITFSTSPGIELRRVAGAFSNIPLAKNDLISGGGHNYGFVIPVMSP